MTLTGNTYGAEVYPEEWVTKLQERLSEQTIWKDICDVRYTNTRILHNPYVTDATAQSITRDQAYTHQAVVVTDDDVTISTGYILPQYIDRADLAQCDLVSMMSLADSQGVLLNEVLETAVLGAYSQGTDFGLYDITGTGATTDQITVSSSNIDDIIRAMKRKIRTANGSALMERNGMFIVWRPADFELLEAFVQANGFNSADYALRNGTKQGLPYMGVDHFSSNKLTANHLVGGVKKAITLGILKGTYGQIVIDNEPATADGAVSAIAVVSRVDYAVKVWSKLSTVLYDINVA